MTGTPQRSDAILLVRINCLAELANTSNVVDIIHQQFRDCQLVTVTSARSEGLDLLKADKRIGHVHVVSMSGRSVIDRLRSFWSGLRPIRSVKATVICYGATYGLNYNKHILISLALGGIKYFAGPDGRIIRATSRAGRALIFQAVSSNLMNALTSTALLLRYGRISSRRQDEPILRPRDRVLVVRLDSIGDVVATLPIVQVIGQQTGTPVDMLVRKHIASLLGSVPFVGTVHTYNHVHMEGIAHETHDLIGQLRKNRYDVIVELTGNSPTARLFCHLTGAKLIVGLTEHDESPKLSGIKYLDRTLTAYIGEGGYLDRAISVTRQLGLGVDVEAYRFNPSRQSVDRVNSKLQVQEVGRHFAVLHMWGSTPYKSWKESRFAELCDCLVEKRHFDIVLTGSKTDREANERVRHCCQHTDHIHNLAGVFELEELPVLFETAQVVVSVDTGPAHIAGASGATLVILAKTENAPVGRIDSVVSPTAGQPHENASNPLYTITVDQVVDAVDIVLLKTVNAKSRSG